MTNPVGLPEIVCYDPIPTHVMTAWLSILLPIMVAIRCAFMRDRSSDKAAKTAERAFTAISAQFAFFAFCVTTRWFDDLMEWKITAGMRGFRPMLPTLYTLGVLFLLWQLAIQMAVTLCSGWVVSRRLNAVPRLWSPWFSLLAVGLLGGSVVGSLAVLNHLTK